MPWFQLFQDGPEYEARKTRRKFTPPDLSYNELRQAVPRHLFELSTVKSLAYISRHIFFMYLFFRLSLSIDFVTPAVGNFLELVLLSFIRPILWLWYWGWQGITFAGLWCLGHEAGHNALSPYRPINAAIGLAVHTFVLTPYYAWRVTHNTHHKSTNNIERDETYVPMTRKDFKLPSGEIAVKMDYKELLEETPAYTLFKMFVRQFL
uniref:Fatty acid desaturase domain-containing protein n=1 Tax=Psilocybe cubensis TaxID=181762 RepID=A0A8H7XQN3_PSICU